MDMADERHEEQHGSVKVVDRRWWAQQGETAETAGTRAEAAWEPGKPTFVEDLERQLAQKDRQLQETIAKYREASREFDDLRARLRKDIARDVERGRRAMLAELLEVLDNLDRALDAPRAGANAEALVSGVEMVRRLFLAKLEGFGVRRIEALGQPFDPARHEAVTTVPTGDRARDHVVCGVMAQGYTIGDDVLRPAMVAVSQFSGDLAPDAAPTA
jgi:molecular chaperone GrpE